MKKVSETFEQDPLAPRPNLDFSKGVRGKYYDRAEAGSNLILLAPDLLESFPDSDAVNEAFAQPQKIADRAPRKPTRRKQTVAS